MARLSRNLSEETKGLLKELADERGLSIVKQKGLLEHLMRTSSHGELGNSPQRSRSGMRRSKTQLDSLTALRKKDQIIQSGAYERSPAAPPKGREISDKEKEKLIYQMAYRCDPPEMSNLEDMLQKRRAKKIDIEITPRTRQGELKREIDERKEFLEEMQSLGSNIGRQYEGLIRSEIAQKTDELERLRYHHQTSQGSSNEDYEDGDSTDN